MKRDMSPMEDLIAGVSITSLGDIADHRGAVLHMLRSDSPDFSVFGECYFSEVLPGAVKAWKRHTKQTQNLAVPVGRIKIVIVDQREGSVTLGKVNVLELGRPDRYVRLRIPPGLWYGFSCISQTPALLANCADRPHDPNESEIRSLDDPRLSYAWTEPTPSLPQKLIRLSKSCLSGSEKEAVMGVLDRGYLGMGAEVQLFEQALAEHFGRPVVCVVNGTAALQLSIQACGIGPGDEVLVPSLTYVASFQAISATGAKPVACDIDPRTCTIDWRDAQRRVTRRTKAVMPVHYSGGVGDLDGIRSFARHCGLRVIEDAAHAFGSSYRGRQVGSDGDIACFSFDGIKNITSGEGGCVVTNDLSLVRALQDARLLGIEKDSEKRYQGKRSWEFNVTAQGWRYHMSNIMAAIGLKQLERFPELARKRQHLARRYDELLLGHPRIHPLPQNYSEIVPHIYVVRIKGLSDRKQLQFKLAERGIETGIHYQPNHVLDHYYDPQSSPLAVTEAVFPELLSLPMHPELTEDDIETVCAHLIEIFE